LSNSNAWDDQASTHDATSPEFPNEVPSSVRMDTIVSIPSGDTMSPHMPEPVEHALRPLFDALPINRAMAHLVVNGGAPNSHIALVEQVLKDPALEGKDTIEAGLWLYVDELQRSHDVSQGLNRPSGSFWHAIMHRREGDFSNSHHWYRKAGQHPVVHRIDAGGGGAGAGTAIGSYECHAFVDRVERAASQQSDSPDLVAMQRLEWVALFEWCAKHH
jgi:hypothetical protein